VSGRIGNCRIFRHREALLIRILLWVLALIHGNVHRSPAAAAGCTSRYFHQYRAYKPELQACRPGPQNIYVARDEVDKGVSGGNAAKAAPSSPQALAAAHQQQPQDQPAASKATSVAHMITERCTESYVGHC